MRWRRFWAAVCGIMTFLIVLFVLQPARMPDPFFRKVVARGSTPHSGTWERNFEVENAIPRFRVQTNLRGSAADLRIDLERENGFQFLHGWPIKKGLSRFSCGKDVAAGFYTIRVREDNVTGKYSIEIGGRAGITRWQKFLMLLVSIFALSGALNLWRRHRSRVGRPIPALAGSRSVFLATGIALFVVLFYLLLHEGGHALAAISFGSFDLSRSDFFGLYGNPHCGFNPKVQLANWQKAIRFIAGPLLPTLVGYILFAFWRTKWGTGLRGKSAIVDLFWSVTIFTIFFSHLGLLIPITRLGSDSDYSGFINHIPFARWQADALLLIVALINVYLLFRIVRHLVHLVKL